MKTAKPKVDPVADAILAVGRDVRGEERAERRFQRQAAPESRLVLLLGRGMAPGATAGVEYPLAVGEIGRVGRKRARRHGRGHRNEPERGRPNGREDDDEHHNLAQHRLSYPSWSDDQISA